MDVWKEINEAFVTCDFENALNLSIKELNKETSEKTNQLEDVQDNVRIGLWHPINKVDVHIANKAQKSIEERVPFLLSVVLQCAYELRDHKSISFCSKFCSIQKAIDADTLILWLELKLKCGEDISAVATALHEALRAETEKLIHRQAHQAEHCDRLSCGLCRVFAKVTTLLVCKVYLPLNQASRAFEISDHTYSVLPTAEIQDLVAVSRSLMQKNNNFKAPKKKDEQQHLGQGNRRSNGQEESAIQTPRNRNSICKYSQEKGGGERIFQQPFEEMPARLKVATVVGVSVIFTLMVST